MKAFRSALPSTGVTTMSELAIAGSGYHGCGAATVEHKVAIGLAAGHVGSQRPNLNPQAPAFAVAFDVKQVIARAAVLALGRRRGRGHAQHRDRAVGSGD